MKTKTANLLRAIALLGALETRAVDSEARAIDVIASTDAEDGHGTVVEQSWDLKRFKANPVVLFEHGYAGGFLGGKAEEKVPIARAEKVRVEEGKLKARLVFPAAGRHALADEVWNALEDGRLNAVSVGFRPGKVTREELEGGRERYRLSKNVLFEISVVGLPSNPECVAERSILSAMVDLPSCDDDSCIGSDCVGTRAARAARVRDLRVSPRGDPAERDPDDAIDCPCSCHGERALNSKVTATRESAGTEFSMDKFLQILAKKLGCTADEVSIIEALDKATTQRALGESFATATLVEGDVEKQLKALAVETEALRSEVAPLRLRSVLALATLASLGLAETAGEAEVTKSIAGLQGRAKLADELEPMVIDLRKQVTELETAESAREVRFLVERGKDYNLSVGSAAALAAYRKADPKGFAEEFKVALDGLRAFDKPEMFQPVTTPDGKAGAGVNETANRAANDADEFDARVAVYRKAHPEALESQAIDAVLRNLDRA
jgi:HK97 family phage prohead protease